MSPKTVGNHLYRAYPKFGVTSRVAPARLQRNDLRGPCRAPHPAEQHQRPGVTAERSQVRHCSNGVPHHPFVSKADRTAAGSIWLGSPAAAS
ncbi:hypothetical protein [Nocardia sp. NPDC051463]|uniref:hypothetical protein n=1 Tax=Nocardia sp. NPDC051463 TaxID=3154845 RepID=UPI003447C336